jgi:hypothetical protein
VRGPTTVVAGVLGTETPLAACRDGAAFVADVTIPDNTVLQPGVRFEKAWRVRNTGACGWDPSYRLMFRSGTLLGAAGSQVISGTVPGNTADITVALSAPGQPGRYVGIWQMGDPQGQAFGDRLTVVIQVGSPGEAPTPTPVPVPQRQFTGTVRKWYANCGITYAKGKIVDKEGNPVNGLRVRIWADGWDGALSLVSGVGLTYSPGEWDILLRAGQTGKFYLAVWDWQTGPDSYVRVDSEVLTLGFDYTLDNCQPNANGHQVADVRFVRNY